VIVNYFGWKYYKRFDWTSSQLYSLSDKTKKVLQGLNKDIDFIVFMAPGQQRDLYQPTNELLQRYGSASRHVHVKFLDLEKNPLEAQALSQQYGVTTQGVVVASGKDKRVISSADLADIDSASGEPRITGYKGEQLFTSAILQLSEGRKPKILFTTGHGEHSLDDQGNGGLALAQQVLGRDNFDLSEWASLGQKAVPAGTDLLVIAGPTGSFVQPELDAFSAYLNNGGRMLVLLDPTLAPAGAGGGLVKTNLEGWLARYGIKAGQDIVIDPQLSPSSVSPVIFYIKSYGEHPITKAFAGSGAPVIVSLARSMGTGSAPGIKVVDLLRTSPKGWGETDLTHTGEQSSTFGPGDVAGPVSVGAEAESTVTAPGKRPMRLVAFGDSDFATNWLLETDPNNALLLANTLNWLVEREALLGIPPKKTEQVRLTLTPGDAHKVYFVAALLPILSVALGGYVYSRRRR
jgi:ABC-type uncharacterized transport system involved in gliding motility auxiliary subunit